MILCLSPNPAVDRNLVLGGLRPGEVHRAQRVILLPGGKGHNVARALTTLGEETLLLGLVGGGSGRWIAERMPGEYVWFEGETRHCHLLIGRDGVTVVNEPGPQVPPEAWQAFLQRALELAGRARAVVLAGSLPPGADPAGVARLIRETRAPFFLDTSGQALRVALEGRPHAVKVNQAEAGRLTGSADPDQLLRRGVRLAVVTRGAGGAEAAAEEGRWAVSTPDVAAVSAVGSGDAFLAGLVAGQVRGQGLAASLRLAAACGAANTLRVGSGAFSLEDVERLREAVEVKALAG